MCVLFHRYVQEIADDYLVVQLASTIKGRVSILDSAEEPQDLTDFPERFKEGQPIQCRISQVTCTTHVSIVSCVEIRTPPVGFCVPAL